MTSFPDIRMDRRRFALATSAAALVGLPHVRTAIAQDVAPGDLASLGLPELNLTVNADGYDGFPEGDLAAGRYLLTATIAEGLEYAAAAIAGPPPGMSAEELIEVFASFAAPPPDAAAEGSPEAGGEGEEGGPPPDMSIPLWFYRMPLPGGAGGPGGTVIQTVLDLAPGEWVLWGDDPMASQVPIVFNVTGQMPADLAEPEADVTIRMIDFAINIDGSLTAGDHLAHVQNHGAQPHFLVVMRGPDTMTDDDIATLVSVMMEMEAGETPPDLPLNPETDLMPVFQTIQQSIDTNQWTPLSLEAGTYAALCFFPTAGEGLPHAMHGMHTVFTVA